MLKRSVNVATIAEIDYLEVTHRATHDMSEGSTLQVGTAATAQLLDQYQNAFRENHEAAYRDSKNHGADGAWRTSGMVAGGALLGTIGSVAAMALTNVPGPVFNNPVLSAIVIAGAVAGAAGGIWLNKSVAKEEGDAHAITQANLASVEKRLEGIELPGLKEQLQNRRAVAEAQANESIAEQDAKSTRRNAMAFGIGAIAGRS